MQQYDCQRDKCFERLTILSQQKKLKKIKKKI